MDVDKLGFNSNPNKGGFIIGKSIGDDIEPKKISLTPTTEFLGQKPAEIEKIFFFKFF